MAKESKRVILPFYYSAFRVTTYLRPPGWLAGIVWAGFSRCMLRDTYYTIRERGLGHA